MTHSGIEHTANLARYQPGMRSGHYESYFVRANDPRQPRAFWIRYTVFIPRSLSEEGFAELWAIYFDARQSRHIAVKQELPLERAEFSRETLAVRIGGAFLSATELYGGARRERQTGGGEEIRWQLRYAGDYRPVLDLPAKYFDRGFPKAKALAAVPLARFDGELVVNGERVKIDGWPGSQNHNWGTRHTDRYAWGQVAGFRDAPDSFLELATARVRIGPLLSPAMTPLVLRTPERDYELNNFWKAMGRARYGFFWWDFRAKSSEVQIEGRIEAQRQDFVCLRYFNPPGGVKYCLNSKIARATVRYRPAGTREWRELESPHGAAFEILTDSLEGHGLEPRV